MHIKEFLDQWRSGGSAIPEPRAASLSNDDDQDIEVVVQEFECEGQSFMIEYENAKGEQSCRSISVLAVKYNDSGEPYIHARCHHRKAQRSFRIDRIECCIDYDGEVHDPGPFLLETLGLDIDARGPVADVDHARLNAARRQARPHAILLAGLSRSDGYMHPDELAVLRVHCEQLRDDLTLDECNRLGKNYKRLKPTVDQMEDALEMLRSGPPRLLDKFLVASAQLIRADGKVTPEEAELFGQFCEELSGVRVSGLD